MGDADLTRVAVTRSITLTHTWRVGETATDPTGTPSVSVVDANGTTVTTGSATVVGGGSGQTTFHLPAQSLLCLLTVSWTATVAGDTAVEADIVQVVGRRMFDTSRARATQQGLNDLTKFPVDELERRRTQVELEAEWICDRSFIPVYQRDVLDGSGTPDITLSRPDIRTIRRASVQLAPGGTFTDLTSGDLANLRALEDRTLRRTVTGTVWPEGVQNVIVEYEYGLDAPPVTVSDASMFRLRSLAFRASSGIPDRAMSFSTGVGGTFRLSMPGPYNTGLPEVDAAYEAHSLRDAAGEGGSGRGMGMGSGMGRGRGMTGTTVVAPYSQTLQMAPQRNSMFHRR